LCLRPQPLHAAIKNEHPDIALKILDIKGTINVNTVDVFGDTPLITALENDMLPLAQRLIDAGADVNIQSKLLACSSIVHHYANRGNVGILKMITAAPNFVQSSLKCSAGPLGFTPLHLAARGGRDEMCRFLLSRSNVQATDRNGKTAEQVADANHKSATAQLIREWTATAVTDHEQDEHRKVIFEQ
jgi:ankyrin repeat protein